MVDKMSTMQMAQAQAEVRKTCSGGWGGPAVSAIVWLAAAVTADTGRTGETAQMRESA